MQLTNLEHILKTLSDDIIAKYKNDLGKSNLANSVSYTVDKLDGKYVVTLSLEDYWKYVEEGRKPGSFPKFDAILTWVKQKPIIPVQRNGVLPTQEQLAYMIGNSIKQHGISSRPYLSNAVESTDVEDMITDAFSKDIDNYLKT